MNVFKMGWRNVWRNKRRSLVTIAAMTLALWVLLLYSGLIPGFLRSMENTVTELDLGDAQIHAPGYLDAPSLYTVLEESETIVAELEAQGVAASPVLQGGGLAAVGDASAGVMLRALDVERDLKVSRISEAVGEGEWLDSAAPKGVVLGKLLARNLGASVGSELLVVSQAADGSMANELYDVRGILRTVSQNIDRGTVLMTSDAFRELMVVEQGAHVVVLRRGDRSLDELSAIAKGIVRDPFERILATATAQLGDVLIQRDGYPEAHDPGLTVADTPAVRELAQADPHVSGAYDRVLGAAALAQGERRADAVLLGYDPAVEDGGSLPLLGGAVAGALPGAADGGVVLPQSLADELGASVGQDIALALTARSGQPVTLSAPLVATVAPGEGEPADQPALVLMPIAAARQALGYGADEATHLCLRVDLPQNLGLVGYTLGPKLDRALDIMPSANAVPGPDVQTWRELMPAIAQMMDMVGGMIYIFALIIYVAVAILILNAMLTAVFERIREFGVFKAIGAGPFRVFSLILVEGAVQTTVAMVIGVGLALPLMWFLQTKGFNAGVLGGMEAAGVAMPEIWKAEYNATSLAPPLVMLWFISIGAVLYPAMKAAWINPIGAMRYGSGAQRDGLLARAYDAVCARIPLIDRAVDTLLRFTTRPANRVLEAAMPWLATIAWRNLWRQKRRTVLTLVSIAFGFFLAVIMMSTQDRSFGDFIDTAARMGAGHVVVQNADYQDKPSLARTVQGTTALRELAAKDPRVEDTVERIMGEAMVATAHDSFGAAFIAYDPALENDRSFHFLEGIVQGEWFETADDDAVILGKELAANLGAELGDKIVYTMMDKDGEIVAGMARLSGTVGTGAPSADAALFLLPLNKARELLGYAPDEATQVGVYLHDNRDSMAVTKELRGQLPEGVSALAWSEVAPDLRAFVAMKKGGGRFMLMIIGLLVTAGIFNTLFMSVMERVREFGIQLAIGYTPAQIFRMVMWESVYLAFSGLLAGIAVTAWPYKALYDNGIDMTAMYAGQDVSIGGVGFDMHMNLGIYDSSAVIIVCCIIFATLAAGLYPAWKAGKVDPVDSIKLV